MVRRPVPRRVSESWLHGAAELQVLAPVLPDFNVHERALFSERLPSSAQSLTPRKCGLGAILWIFPALALTGIHRYPAPRGKRPTELLLPARPPRSAKCSDTADSVASICRRNTAQLIEEVHDHRHVIRSRHFVLVVR